ncbi:MAG: hypothetical protein U9R75_06045 [Candidatus Thermoplasmatota archaeon]|nr:hypothetical protein [Candidatus Thermoplasmatota archaeon]
MGIKDLFFGNKRMITYQRVKTMTRDGDISGLVHSIEDASPEILPYVLSALRKFTEGDNGEIIIRLDTKAKLRNRMNNTYDTRCRREMALLIIGLLVKGFGKRILYDELALDLVRMLPGSDLELRTALTWAVPVLIEEGPAREVVDAIDIPDLVEQLDKENRSLLCNTTYLLAMLSSTGAVRSIYRSGALEHLKLLKQNPDTEISNYAGLAFNRIQEWKDGSSRFGDVIAGKLNEEADLKPDARVEELKDRRSKEGYVRPEKKKRKKRPGGIKLRPDGSRIEKEDDRVVELKGPKSSISLEYIKRQMEKDNGTEE